MRITDELREYAQDWRETPSLMNDLDAGDVDGILADFERIADRIDAKHESAMYDMWREHDEWVAERDANYVKLPVDANNVPIRIGDVIAYKDNTKPKEVVALMPPSVVMVEDGPRFADMCCHYRKPTVEDVLREFALAVCKDDALTIRKGVVEKYAAKLRLAGDAE